MGWRWKRTVDETARLRVDLQREKAGPVGGVEIKELLHDPIDGLGVLGVEGLLAEVAEFELNRADFDEEEILVVLGGGRRNSTTGKRFIILKKEGGSRGVGGYVFKLMTG